MIDREVIRRVDALAIAQALRNERRRRATVPALQVPDDTLDYNSPRLEQDFIVRRAFFNG